MRAPRPSSITPLATWPAGHQLRRVEEEEERGLVKDLERHGRLAVNSAGRTLLKKQIALADISRGLSVHTDHTQLVDRAPLGQQACGLRPAPRVFVAINI